MKFKNNTKSKIMYRIDTKKNSSGYDWITARVGDIVDVEKAYGEKLGLTPLKEAKKDEQNDKEVPKKEEIDEDKVIIDEKKDEKKLYSKTDLIDLKKPQQIKILKEEFNLSDEEINKLTNEGKRINKILKLQNAKA